LTDSLVRDRIVVGLRNKRLSEQLQLEKDLTLAQAEQKVRQAEKVKQQQQVVQSAGQHNLKMMVDIEAVKTTYPKRTAKGRYQATTNSKWTSPKHSGSTSSSQPSTNCKYCGLAPHERSTCPARDSICSKCHKRGHWQKVCLAHLGKSTYRNKSHSSVGNVNLPDENGQPNLQDPYHTDDPHYLGKIDNAKPCSAAWTIMLEVNGHPAVFKIDTGADVSILSEDLFKLIPKMELHKAGPELAGPGSTPLRTAGKAEVTLTYHNRSCLAQIYCTVQYYKTTYVEIGFLGVQRLF